MCAFAPLVEAVRAKSNQNTIECRDQAPRHIASNARAQHRPHPMPISQVCIRMSWDESVSPTPVPDTPSPPLERCDRKPWEYPTAGFRLLACRCALASPAAESSCPTTSDSRACRDCLPNPVQTLRSSVHRFRLLPGSPLPVYKHPKPIASECSTTLLCPKGLLPFPVDLSVKLNDVAPWLQSRYRTFIATTRNSAPALRLGTRALAGRPLEFLPSHRVQVPTFHTRAWTGFTPPRAGRRLSSKQVPLRLIPD